MPIPATTVSLTVASITTRLVMMEEQYSLDEGSFVRVERCNFTNNHAADKGEVITIIGSAAEIIETNMYDNTADLGETNISCNSTVETSIPSQTDPNISFCSYYAANIDHFNTVPTLSLIHI